MEGEHSLKIPDAYLLHFWSVGILKILRNRITLALNDLMSIKGVCSTAWASQGLLIGKVCLRISRFLQMNKLLIS